MDIHIYIYMHIYNKRTISYLYVFNYMLWMRVECLWYYGWCYDDLFIRVYIFAWANRQCMKWQLSRIILCIEYFPLSESLARLRFCVTRRFRTDEVEPVRDTPSEMLQEWRYDLSILYFELKYNCIWFT